MAGLVGVAFDGVHDTAVAVFHNAYMVADAIVVPIEIDYFTGLGGDAAVHPLALVLEPLDAGGAVGMLEHGAGFNVAALVTAPTYKTGAPFPRLL